ncbi:MAG: hypothetical protein WCA39_01600 [Nitrososphaeraceae archaeon]
MAQKDKRIVVISKTNYDTLRKIGTLTDSFDSVITELLEVARPLVLERRQENLLQINQQGARHSSDQSAVEEHRTICTGDTAHEL